MADDKAPELGNTDDIAKNLAAEAAAAAAAEAAAQKGSGRGKKADQKVEASTDGLVLVRKGDEKLYVHPTTVKSHKAAGWIVD